MIIQSRVKALPDRMPFSPEDKHEGKANGVAALVGHTTDEIYKASVHLGTVMADPKLASSQEPLDSPFSIEHDNLECFAWLSHPDNVWRLKR